MPLNSKNVNVVLLKQLTKGLGVSETDLPDELRQSIKEKLSEMGHEPRTIQVHLEETTHGMRIAQQDTDGIFLDLVTEEPVRHSASESTVKLHTVKKTLKPYGRHFKR